MYDFSLRTIQVHIARFNPTLNEYQYLILKRSESIKTYPGIWQTVTGTIETNESALTATIRELKEETSLESDNIWCLPYVTTFFDYYENKVNFAPVFGVLVDFKEIVSISEEHTEFKWADFDECHELMVLPSHRDGLRVFRDYCLSEFGKHYLVKL